MNSETHINNPKLPSFLILDDNDVFASTLARALSRRGFVTTIAHNGQQALTAAEQTPFSFVTIDLQLAEDSALQWIAPLREQLPQARLLVLTGYASIATTVQAIKLGADNYLAKPANVDSILSALQYDAISVDNT
ncbi:MAG: response regulator, partial [Glaciimonas sp.]|nr:response regulator [Glaciimonas sp.]